ncbi:MAG: hypothetical protein WEC16_01175, partial [Anaerolineales bacterium]
MNKVISTVLLALLISSCGAADQPVLTSFALPASVEVTFSALLPAPPPSGDLVQFILLDEVTGLEFNRKLIGVSATGESSVSVTLSVPPGTLVKYRYTLHRANGGVVQYGIDHFLIA